MTFTLLTLAALALLGTWLHGRASGIRVERGRHFIGGLATMPTLHEVYPKQTQVAFTEPAPTPKGVTRLRINVGIVAGPRSTFPISQAEVDIHDFSVEKMEGQIASALTAFAKYSEKKGGES